MRRPVLLPVLAASLLAVPLVVVPSRASRPVLAEQCGAQIVTTLPIGAHGTMKWPECAAD
jgi:hypothetical protein